MKDIDIDMDWEELRDDSTLLDMAESFEDVRHKEEFLVMFLLAGASLCCCTLVGMYLSTRSELGM